MITKQLDTQEAPFKWAAAQDRHMRNSVNKTLYTQQQCARALRMMYALETVYTGRFFDEPSYGKTGISVKIENAYARDRKMLAILEDGFAKEGIIKKVTPQGITYRIPK